MKTAKVLVCVSLALFIAAGVAYAKPEHKVPGWAEKEFKLNLLAYNGISIGMLMSENSITLGEFVATTKSNVAAINDPLIDPVIVKKISQGLDALSTFLNGPGAEFKAMTLRRLETDDSVQNVEAHPGFPDLKKLVGDLEKDKLTLPWLGLNMKTTASFWQLFTATHFVELLYDFEISDFFSVPMDDPEVTEEMIAATQLAIDEGAFGALHQLWNEMNSAPGTRAYSCCNRTTKKCQDGPPAANCGPVGTTCPMGATWCP